ncbi:hypothetical protein DXG01_004376, partial [Tephrocybe rancida]
YRSQYYDADSTYFYTLQRYCAATDEVDKISFKWLMSKRKLNQLEAVGNTLSTAGCPPMDSKIITAQICVVIQFEKDMIKAYAAKVALENELINDGMAWCSRPVDELLAETLQLEAYGPSPQRAVVENLCGSYRRQKHTRCQEPC